MMSLYNNIPDVMNNLDVSEISEDLKNEFKNDSK
jgi:hypothetical protein